MTDVLRLHAPGDVRLHRERAPRPADGEVLVRVTAVGLCGSDRHWFLESAIGDTPLREPLVLGHEFAGVIETGPRSGERVAADPADACGRCDACLADRGHLCARVRFAGHAPIDGALRTLVAWPARLLVPVPAAIPDPEASLLEPLGVALHAIDLGSVEPGMRAAVHGCGPIGLLLIRALLAAGVREVVAADPLPHRAAAARASGARAGWGAEFDLGEVDVSFETAGDDDALDAAIASTRAAGRVVLVGIPGRDRTSFRASVARRRELSLVHARRMHPDDLARAVALVERGAVSLAGLVTHRYPLSRGAEAFAALSERRGLKVVVEPGGG